MNYYTERPINGHPHGLPPSDIVSDVSFVSADSQVSNYVFKHQQNLCRFPGKGFVVYKCHFRSRG